MNPRYLWADDYLLEGNSDVFWGLMDDIWYFMQNKISPFDSRNNALLPPKRLSTNPTFASTNILSKNNSK